MKLLRFGPIGQETPALLDAQGQVRDLSGVIADIRAETLTPEGLQRLRAIDRRKPKVIRHRRIDQNRAQARSIEPLPIVLRGCVVGKENLHRRKPRRRRARAALGPGYVRVKQ